MLLINSHRINMFRNFQTIFSKTLQYSCTTVPSRTMFILRRKYQPRLNKIDAEIPKKLKKKDFYYILVEETSHNKLPYIELILLKNVKGVGNAGDIIKEKTLYAYELYILSGAATYATPENIQKYAHIKKKDEIPMYIKNLLDELSHVHVPVFVHEVNPWTIEPWHIRLSLRKIGIICNVDCIKLPDKPISGPNHDLEKKDFAIHLTVNKTFTVPMRCRLFHLTFAESNFNISFDSKFYLQGIDAIFPEEKALLEKIPLPVEKKSFSVIIE